MAKMGRPKKLVTYSKRVEVMVTSEVKQALEGTTPDDLRDLLEKYSQVRQKVKELGYKDALGLFAPDVRDELLADIGAERLQDWLNQIMEARKSGVPTVIFSKPWGEGEALRYVSLLYVGEKAANHETG